METKLVESTRGSLPFTKLQMPPDQNKDATNYLENENTKYFKKTVRGLGVRKKSITS